MNILEGGDEGSSSKDDQIPRLSFLANIINIINYPSLEFFCFYSLERINLYSVASIFLSVIKISRFFSTKQKGVYELM